MLELPDSESHRPEKNQKPTSPVAQFMDFSTAVIWSAYAHIRNSGTTFEQVLSLFDP